MDFLRERIGHLIQELSGLRYPQTESILWHRFQQTTTRVLDLSDLSDNAWRGMPEKQSWGGHRAYYWFDTEASVPATMAGKRVILSVITGRENSWDATNPQFSLYVDGKLRQGLDVNHREAVLSDSAEAGQRYRLTLSAFTGDNNFDLKLETRLKIVDPDTEQYYYDLLVPYQVTALLKPDSPDAADIIRPLNESLNRLDLRRPHSAEYAASLKEARDYLQRAFYKSACGKAVEATVACVGHTHIDVAWLWPLIVTEDKAVRTFSTMLELMARYPEFVFMSSQPQLYRYVEKNAPDVFAGIRKRVAEGRWEAEGAMFVEADCNIASGEALVRQILVGTRYFRDRFGVDNKILWLPDVFGYSAALPQILQKSGIPYFMTTKISWNESNRMPYDTFTWEGIDGTRVLTHFIPSRDFDIPNRECDRHPSHYTTYNATLNPSQVKGGWKRYQQKYLNREILMSYGFGDGGGGPTAEMLETQRRLALGIPGCPQTRISTARGFFERLDRDVADDKYLPNWSGELYLEYHRGTYTSMARNKKANRKAEFACQNLEWLGALDVLLAGGSYPKAELDDAWEVILRNQFHDILPGSSIKEVYDDSKAEYDATEALTTRLSDDRMRAVAAASAAGSGDLVVFNPHGFTAFDLVTVDFPEATAGTGEAAAVSRFDGDGAQIWQRTADNRMLVSAADIPARGYAALRPDEPGRDLVYGVLRHGPDDELQVTDTRLSNAFFEIRLNRQGQFSSILDKRAGRELLKPGASGNVLVSYEDKPHNYDAWDVNNYYAEKSWPIDDVQRITVTEQGPLRGAVAIERRYLDSTIRQTVMIYRDIPRIDIRNEIDWKERQIFVKCLFPVDIHAVDASFDIQYGNVRRPTHRNTSWDAARFEVCMHKWLDVSEDGYGLSVLNDSKYGCHVHDGVIGISMLKSAISPNPEADKERHDFLIALYPHPGDWRQADTERQALLLNNPLRAVWKTDDPGDRPARFSLVAGNQPNVAVDVVKRAEDSDAWIVRVHEFFNRRTEFRLTFGRPVRRAVLCDLMEKEREVLAIDDDAVTLNLRPYDIVTIKADLE